MPYNPYQVRMPGVQMPSTQTPTAQTPTSFTQGSATPKANMRTSNQRQVIDPYGDPVGTGANTRISLEQLRRLYQGGQ